MRLFLSVFVVFMSFSMLSGQGKFFTKKGTITFKSDTPLEKIEAENKTSTFVIDTEKGNLQLAVLIKAFHFEKALMQEHFNENYMESSKFPKATFKGKIANMDMVNFENDGTYEVSIEGNMTIHGVTKEIAVPATFTIENGAISGNTVFDIAVADYGIEIPKLVRENIAKEVSISVDVDLEKLSK